MLARGTRIVSCLLDTHVLLWAFSEPDRIGAQATERIGAENRVYVSTASLWEIAIKVSIGKLKADISRIYQTMEARSLTVLHIEQAHILAVSKPPFHHRDPFDRMLIAQALTNELHLITRDNKFEAYNAPLMDASR